MILNGKDSQEFKTHLDEYKKENDINESDIVSIAKIFKFNIITNTYSNERSKFVILDNVLKLEEIQQIPEPFKITTLEPQRIQVRFKDKLQDQEIEFNYIDENKDK